MKKGKRIALNRLFNFCIIVGLFFAYMAYDCLINGDTAWGIGIGTAALLFAGSAAVFTPYCYVFDNEGLSLCYAFLPNERYLWKCIYAIEAEDLEAASGRRSLLLFLLYSVVFSIHGETVGKCRFYMKGRIRKSFRTKRLLEHYWDGTITGYLLEDVKEWLNKRKAKKQKQQDAHLKDEAVSMEREARAKAREWLKPLEIEAARYKLTIKSQYLYVTKNLEKLKSRPEEGYTYTLVAEIVPTDETDISHVTAVGVDLLYVRLGKKAYRGVKNKHAQEGLRLAVSAAITDITKGIRK